MAIILGLTSLAKATALTLIAAIIIDQIALSKRNLIFLGILIGIVFIASGWFYDCHNNIVPVQPFLKIGILLIILSLPMIFFGGKEFVKQ